MASLSEYSTLGASKITKSRSKTTMKPILKKTSHSEKNSLELDRGWEDAIHYGNHGWGGGSSAARSTFLKYADGHTGRAGGGLGLSEASGGGMRSGRDVSFSLSTTDLSSSCSGTRKFAHARSTSGTSHISVATSGSSHHHGGARNGSFVHPFQQTPRASTPPLSYANSLASFDNSNSQRDYSPTITEDDDLEPQNIGPRNYRTTPYPAQAFSHSRRRPSAAGQPTSSQSELTGPPSLKINTGQATPTASRLSRSILTTSRSDLRLDILSPTQDSPAASTVTACATSQSITSPQLLTSPSSSVAPSLSPIRSSLEMNFRLRSRSELDTVSRQEQIRKARREFEDKEAMKQAIRDEKAARKRDAQVEREAQKFVKKQKQLAKANGLASGRDSVSFDVRPSYSRKNTGATNDLVLDTEKLEFAASNYAATEPGLAPTAEDTPVGSPPRRIQSAKRKTASAWTSFILWVRTKLFKAGRR